MTTAVRKSRIQLFDFGRRLYDWVISWAENKYSEWALFLIALAESSFFPVPPDVLLMAMGVGAPRRALRFALICLIGSVIGGLLGYGIGMVLWSALQDFFFSYVPGFTPELFASVTQLYQENAFWAVFTAGFTPIPYKIFTIAAGVAEINLISFLVASVFARGMRFFLVGGILRIFGPTVKELIDKYFNLLTVIFTVLLIGGFIVVKSFF